MTRLKLRTPLVLAVAAAIAALTAATAIGGGIRRFESKVRLARTDQFHGKVISDKHACEAHRLVKVFNAAAGPNGLLGKTRADHRGKWSFPAPMKGDFYAKVKRHKKRTARGGIVCRADLSPVRHFSG